jgi:glycosyltransferase involved in cell wall biosynthesis
VRHYVPRDRISIVRDFVDTVTYRPTTPLQPTPRVLFVSNYKKWKAHYRLQRACRRLGLAFKAVGSPYGRSRSMPTELNAADLVVSWGRGVLEAMACGRAVMSYDKELGDGYLTPTVYVESRERNFCGYECRHCFTVDELMVELQKYRQEDGAVNRTLAEAHHDHRAGTDLVLDACARARA